MSQNKIAKNTTFYTTALALQKVLSFFYFILIARYLAVDEVGKFAFALGFTTIFAIVLDFGLTQALIRESARNRAQSVNLLVNALGIKIISSVLVYGIVFLMINLMGYPALTRQLVYVTGVVMIFDSFALTFYGILRGHQNLKFESMGTVINQLIILIVGYIVLQLNLGLVVLMSVYVLGSIFNLSFSIVWFKLRTQFRLAIHFDWQIIKTLFKLALPFAIAGIFIRLYSYMDIVLLSKLADDTAVGYYSVAYRVAFALQFVGVASLASIYPAFSHYYLHNKDLLGGTFTKVMHYLMIISIPLSVGVIVVADKIIGPVFGSQYENSVVALQIMMVAIPLAFLSFPVGAMLNATNHQNINTVILGLTAFSNILLNLFLIPKFSYVGSAIAVPLSYLILFGVGVYMVGRFIKYDGRYVAFSLIRVLFSAILMGGSALYLLNYLNVFVVIALSAIIYFICLYLIGGYSKKELLHAYALIFKKDITA